MTALNKQAYRADGGDIGIGRLKEIADNAYSDEEKRWLAQRVLALLGELEKEKGYASAYEGEKWHYHQLAESEGERANREEAKLDAAEKRIAELEARTPYGYLRQCDGQIQISIGSEQPHNRSGGYATPWFAIYTAAAGKGEAS